MIRYTKNLAVHENYDIIVVGGGPAGCAAAAAAGREGRRVLLIESSGALGGMGTMGLVPALAPYSDQERLIYRGLAATVLEAVRQDLPHVRKRADWVNWVPVDPEALKRHYDDLMETYHVDVLFHTLMVDVLSENGHVTGLVAAGKDGLTVHRAPVYVDCTGDADIAVGAGAPYAKGEEGSGNLQPASLCFILTNVDEYAYLNGPNLHPQNPDSPIYRIVREGKYPIIPDTHLCQNLIGPRTVGFNASHLWDVDSNDPASLSRAQREGRRIAKALRDALAEYVPAAFANAQLIETAAVVGIREGRRIQGEYVLCIDDYLARRDFPDEIGRNCYYLDVHHDKAHIQEAIDNLAAHRAKDHRYGKGESHGIPYRCLLPRQVDNVLVAGRCISTDRLLQGSTRVMPACLVTGEAAGLAAALSLPSGLPAEVNTELLREKLRAYGVYIH